ncbi:MAG TPA: SDR family oxidoreductase [Candidatus Margulisiibacteriota bacterium]|nr:SDR family oxidoreductase [Candidatus Margulisiibacteriota bacterium]
MYLVTGGAGFIGSNIVEALVRKGERVRVLDNFSTGDRANLAAVHERVEIVEGDLRDMEAVRRAVAGVTYVCHQAALRSVPRSVDDPLSTDAVNTHGTLQLLVAAHEAHVRRVVYASSSSVYGDSPVLPKVEDQTPAPISPYAVAKLAAELYCRMYTRLYGLETVSLRYFNVFGPKQSPESKYAAVVPLFIRAALNSEPLIVHGDGEQSRDFTYIDNVVQANLLACTTPGIGGEVFNVACNSRHSVLEIALTVQTLLGRKLTIEHTPARAGDVRHTQASIDKAVRLLNYHPTVGFEDGMRRTFESLRAELARSAAARAAP